MKKEILEKLKAKFEGVSDSILGRIADNLAKTATTEEEVAAAVAGVTFQRESISMSQRTGVKARAFSVGGVNCCQTVLKPVRFNISKKHMMC